SKIHLFSLMSEKQYFQPGQHTFLFDVNQHRCGTLICYDLRFPELSRKLALQGAEILFFPMEWPFPRTEIFQTLLKARAIENQCFVVGNNICGNGFSPGLRFEGKSAVISPFGEVLGEMGDTEGILDVSLDFALIKKCREQISCFPDRRPELYRLS
ncbi:MAG: nitrilase-related carbon-nitrogen hydrolase, partial [Planctomycetota bacterium]